MKDNTTSRSVSKAKAIHGFTIMILVSLAFAGPFTSVKRLKMRVENQCLYTVCILAYPVMPTKRLLHPGTCRLCEI